jgi:SAM-dependent methyltransferase
MPSEVSPGPFARHPLRRYAFGWQQLAGRSGRHLDLGCGHGEFLLALHGGTALTCLGADPHAGYLAGIRRERPDVPLQQVSIAGRLGFAGSAFDSVSMLDVLEHVPDEAGLLAEVRRILAPGGLLVLTVPRRHVFSFLDPDNAKFRLPGLHRLVYRARFGRRTYRERFGDLSDGLRGDMSVGKDEHTNYRPAALLALLAGAGFQPLTVTGANLFWRWFQIPALLLGGPPRRLLDRLIYVDGVLFRSANLFVTARRVP